MNYWSQTSEIWGSKLQTFLLHRRIWRLWLVSTADCYRSVPFLRALKVCSAVQLNGSRLCYHLLLTNQDLTPSHQQAALCDVITALWWEARGCLPQYSIILECCSL
jgi:hypothetical protein